MLVVVATTVSDGDEEARGGSRIIDGLVFAVEPVTRQISLLIAII